METWIDSLNFNGLLIGALTFLIIGASHPAVIKGEYYFGTRIWWAFLLLGLLGIAAAVYGSFGRICLHLPVGHQGDLRTTGTGAQGMVPAQPPAQVSFRPYRRTPRREITFPGCTSSLLPAVRSPLTARWGQGMEKGACRKKKKCRKRLSGIKNLLKNIQHQSSMITWTKMRRFPGNANPLCWLIFPAAIPTTTEYRGETPG